MDWRGKGDLVLVVGSDMSLKSTILSCSIIASWIGAFEWFLTSMSSDMCLKVSISCSSIITAWISAFIPQLSSMLLNMFLIYILLHCRKGAVLIRTTMKIRNKTLFIHNLITVLL